MNGLEDFNSIHYLRVCCSEAKDKRLEWVCVLWCVSSLFFFFTILEVNFNFVSQPPHYFHGHIIKIVYCFAVFHCYERRLFLT